MQRTFITGSEWLYYKIYCGAKTSDILLEETIRPLMGKLVRGKKIDKWFFIRYRDPDYHIRLRLHFFEIKHIGSVIEEVKNELLPYVNNDSIHKVQLDIYQRELERYGENTMEQAESLFYNDSVCCCQALENIIEEDVWILCTLKSMDDLLENFGFNANKKLAFATQQMGLYKEEFEINKSTNRDLSKKFRERKIDIGNFLNQPAGQQEFKSLFNLLQDKSQKDKAIIKEALDPKNNISILYNKLVSSLIHMSVNRAFRSKQRVYEMLLYDFLVRYYRSIIGRELVN